VAAAVPLVVPFQFIKDSNFCLVINEIDAAFFVFSKNHILIIMNAWPFIFAAAGHFNFSAAVSITIEILIKPIWSFENSDGFCVDGLVPVDYTIEAKIVNIVKTRAFHALPVVAIFFGVVLVFVGAFIGVGGRSFDDEAIVIIGVITRGATINPFDSNRQLGITSTFPLFSDSNRGNPTWFIADVDSRVRGGVVIDEIHPVGCLQQVSSGISGDWFEITNFDALLTITIDVFLEDMFKSCNPFCPALPVPLAHAVGVDFDDFPVVVDDRLFQIATIWIFGVFVFAFHQQVVILTLLLNGVRS